MGEKQMDSQTNGQTGRMKERKLENEECCSSGPEERDVEKHE